MDELRNLIIIIPALGTILISLAWFILNYPYTQLKERYNPIVKEYSKIQTTIRTSILIFYILFFSFTFLLSIIYLFSKNIVSDNIKSVNNLELKLVFLFSLIILMFIFVLETRLFTRYIFKNRVKNNKISPQKKLMILSGLGIFLGGIIFFLSLILMDFMIEKSININFKNSKFVLKTNLNSLKDKLDENIFISVNGKEFRLYNKQNQEESLNMIRVNIENENSYLYVNKEFNIFEDDIVSLKINDTEVIREKYKSYSHLIEYINKIAILICPSLVAVYSSGIIFAWNKIKSLKTYKIEFSKTSCVGKILFEYDNFYLVEIESKFKYIAKKEVNELLEINEEYIKL